MDAVFSGTASRLRLALPLLLVLAAAGTLQARAQSLEDALVAGYLSNPTLLGERAALRATNEAIAQALAGWRPDVSIKGSHSYRTSISSGFVEGSHHPSEARLQIRQNLYRGGRTQNAVAAAEQRIRAGQAHLDMIEQQVLLEIITAYFNVGLAREEVELGRNTTRLLERQLEAAEDRFEVGEITRTDVAQAQARLAQARSTLSQSERKLAAARAEYIRLTGQHPGARPTESHLPPLPASHEEALALALDHAPVLKNSEHSARARRYDVETAKGSFLPEVNLNGQYQYRHPTPSSGQSRDEFSVTAEVSLPLYQRGDASSRVREAASKHAEARMDVLATERSVRAKVLSAWEELRSVRARIVSDERQVAANEVAFDGILREAEAGLRTTLDILDGEQELFDARVSLTRSRRDEFVAAYALLQTIGRMSARDLRLPVDYFDPMSHYRLTRGRRFGYDEDEGQHPAGSPVEGDQTGTAE